MSEPIHKRIAEHPEDFELRVEYVKHTFAMMRERCEHYADALCFHPEHKRLTKCAIRACPLLGE